MCIYIKLILSRDSYARSECFWTFWHLTFVFKCSLWAIFGNWIWVWLLFSDRMLCGSICLCVCESARSCLCGWRWLVLCAFFPSALWGSTLRHVKLCGILSKLLLRTETSTRAHWKGDTQAVNVSQKKFTTTKLPQLTSLNVDSMYVLYYQTYAYIWYIL